MFPRRCFPRYGPIRTEAKRKTLEDVERKRATAKQSRVQDEQ